MNPAVPVFAASARYRAAVAELPTGTRKAGSVRGSVVDIPGSGDWWTALLHAQAEGAVAAVVGNPQKVPAEAVATLLGRLSIPVAVERSLARPDDLAAALAARSGGPATLVTIECSAPAGDEGSALRDGLRWAATLAGGPLEATSVPIPAEGGMALLHAATSRGHLPVTVLTTRLSRMDALPVLRVAALGEVRSVVESGPTGAGVRLTTSSVGGSTLAAARYESPARLALRRAVDAATSGALLPDLADLLEDQRIVATLLQMHNQG
ncbi:hypothetical protein [Paenarthrobacter sp. NCHU4564]|uniref:hypothetical protein n=1 Tax=Paenarthrobacter sp. NCHU4564 TaxID=3451353 RepID=UPI003F96F647